MRHQHDFMQKKEEKLFSNVIGRVRDLPFLACSFNSQNDPHLCFQLTDIWKQMFSILQSSPFSTCSLHFLCSSLATVNHSKQKLRFLKSTSPAAAQLFISKRSWPTCFSSPLCSVCSLFFCRRCRDREGSDPELCGCKPGWILSSFSVIQLPTSSLKNKRMKQPFEYPNGQTLHTYF